MAVRKGEMKKIPSELYMALFRWSYLEQISDDELRKEANKFFEERAKRDAEHDFFTKSRTAATPEERREYQKKYDDSIGRKASFRTY